MIAIQTFFFQDISRNVWQSFCQRNKTHILCINFIVLLYFYASLENLRRIFFKNIIFLQYLSSFFPCNPSQLSNQLSHSSASFILIQKTNAQSSKISFSLCEHTEKKTKQLLNCYYPCINLDISHDQRHICFRM